MNGEIFCAWTGRINTVKMLILPKAVFATQWTTAHQASLSFTISWSLLKLMSIESVLPSTKSSSFARFSCPPSFPASGSFPVSQLFASDGQSIEVSASASVLPMNIQGWFSLELTGLISLLSKRLSRVFSSTTIRKFQFFGTQPSLWSKNRFGRMILS